MFFYRQDNLGAKVKVCFGGIYHMHLPEIESVLHCQTGKGRRKPEPEAETEAGTGSTHVQHDTRPGSEGGTGVMHVQHDIHLADSCGSVRESVFVCVPAMVGGKGGGLVKLRAMY